MEQLKKVLWAVLIVFALFTFWPLVVGLIVLGFFLYASTKSTMMKRSFMEDVVRKGYNKDAANVSNADVFEAEYTEKEVRHE